MRVLVTFAVDAEFAPWRKLRKFRKEEIVNSGHRGGSDVAYRGEVDGAFLDVCMTGMGWSGTNQALQHLFAKRPDVVISSGLAGALRDELRPGDTFVPRRIRTLNNDADAVPEVALFERAAQAGAKAIETLITARELVKTAEEKRRLGFFGEAVDMESAHVMMKCREAEIPCVTIRTISDSVDEDLPIDFDRCLTRQGTVRPMSLVNTIVARPSRLPKLIRFGRQSNEAIHQMIRFLDGFVASLTGATVVAG